MKLSARTGMIGILILTASIYAMSVQNGFVNLDDTLLVTENTHVQHASLANIGYVFTHFDPELYIPLTLLSYQLETWTLGHAAWHYHLFSLLLHFISVWLVFEIVKRFAKSDRIGLITALLFAIHPINSEAVLWVSARKDLLSSIFFLASLLCFFIHQEKRIRYYFLLSLLFFILGLLSKVTILTLPVIIFLLTVALKDTKNHLRTMTPFALLSAIFGSIAILGKGAVEQKLEIVDFILMAFRSMYFYLTLIVRPDGQSAIHSLLPHDMYSPLLLVSMCVTGLLSWIFFVSRKRLPLVLAGWVFFLVTLSPSFLHYTRGTELFMLGSERYMYLPSLGLFLIIAALWNKLWNLPRLTKPTKIIFSLTSAIIIGVLCYLTILRTFIFEDPIIFNVDILQKNSADGRTWYNLGIALENEMKPMEAEEAYLKALAAKPDLANAAISLGILYQREGRTQESITMFQKATEVRPDYFKGYFHLGIAEQNLGNTDAAISALKKTIELFPDFPAAHSNLATLYGQKKMFKEAIAEFEILAEIDPNFGEQLALLKAKIR